MNNTEILQKVLQVVDEHKNAEGWTDLALIGKPLNDFGVNYKAHGYLKLRELLEDFPEHLEIKRDATSYKMPVLYVKAKSTGSSKPRPIKSFTKARYNANHTPNNLLDWAWMGDFKSVISNL